MLALFLSVSLLSVINAAPTSGTGASASASGAASTPPRFVLDTGVEAKSAGGATIRADLRDEYLTGYPLVVEITVRNDGTTPVTIPDLTARRHLVHFEMVGPDGKTTERFSTPPQFDAGGDSSLSPRGRRSVLLELPGAASMPVGSYKLTLHIGEANAVTTLPTQNFQVVPVKPLPGSIPTESAASSASGLAFVWVQAAQAGFDVYLDQYTSGVQAAFSARFRLMRTSVAIVPMLSRGASSTNRSRHLYWTAGDNAVRVADLNGTRLDGAPRLYSAPWPKVELLARGITDAKGGFMVPLWVPGPKAGAGFVRILCADARGGVLFRPVADFAARPIAESGVDAGGNLLLALGHEKGLDLYRVDAAWPPELPAAGKRAWKAEGGWTTAAIAFDSLPDQGERAGGLALIAEQLLPATTTLLAQGRTLWADLGGKLIQTSTPTPWIGSSAILNLLPAGYGPPHVLVDEGAKGVSYLRVGGMPSPLGDIPNPTLAVDVGGNGVVRWLAGANVMRTRTINPPP